MNIKDGLKRQLRSVIEWQNPDPNALFFKWTENGDEIKNASKLLINPGQGCIFVYEGRVEAVHTQSGLIQLQTANIPFWTTITKFMQAFESEHKVGIYFFKTTKILDQKWGTPAVIKYEDPKYKFPVGLRAFGNYTFRISDPGSFFINVAGTTSDFFIDQFRPVLSSRLIEPLTDYFAEAGFTYTEIDANRNELSQGISEKLKEVFAKLGFEITDFRIEGTNFDEDTMNRINMIADMSAKAQAAQAAGLNYAQMEQLGAMRDAAKNEGGGAGLGMGLGAGMGFGNMMAGAMGANFMNQNPNPGQVSPANQSPNEDPVSKLKKLKEMFEAELITEEEYSKKKQEILAAM
jgi:membrane protease subunit (stomatin/prohibitin family)